MSAALIRTAKRRGGGDDEAVTALLRLSDWQRRHGCGVAGHLQQGLSVALADGVLDRDTGSRRAAGPRSSRQSAPASASNHASRRDIPSKVPERLQLLVRTVFFALASALPALLRLSSLRRGQRTGRRRRAAPPAPTPLRCRRRGRRPACWSLCGSPSMAQADVTCLPGGGGSGHPTCEGPAEKQRSDAQAFASPDRVRRQATLEPAPSTVNAPERSTCSTSRHAGSPPARTAASTSGSAEAASGPLVSEVTACAIRCPGTANCAVSASRSLSNICATLRENQELNEPHSEETN